jgi:hypothetical protein
MEKHHGKITNRQPAPIKRSYNHSEYDHQKKKSSKHQG